MTSHIRASKINYTSIELPNCTQENYNQNKLAETTMYGNMVNMPITSIKSKVWVAKQKPKSKPNCAGK